MLARVTTPKPADFAASLIVPLRPASIEAAKSAWQKAKADRERAQEQHREAVRQQREQVAGQPTVITAAQVDELGAAIAGFVEAERTAKQKFEAEITSYQETCSEALRKPLTDYHAELATKIGDLESLLRQGADLQSAARANGVKLPSKVPGLCGYLITHVVEQARRILGSADA
jgi:chromosome segregation ATPase